MEPIVDLMLGPAGLERPRTRRRSTAVAQPAARQPDLLRHRPHGRLLQLRQHVLQRLGRRSRERSLRPVLLRGLTTESTSVVRIQQQRFAVLPERRQPLYVPRAAAPMRPALTPPLGDFTAWRGLPVSASGPEPFDAANCKFSLQIVSVACPMVSPHAPLRSSIGGLSRSVVIVGRQRARRGRR